jgi:ankyrin repeat protein
VVHLVKGHEGGGEEAQVRKLLAGGARPDRHRGKASGKTAMLEAASKGHCHVVRILLAGGANPEAKDFSGHTAIVEAVR